MIGSTRMGAITYHDEARRLRALASSEGVAFAFSPHAEREMRKDKLTRVDIMSTLRACSVVSVELHGFEWRWTAAGRTDDGDRIEIVCVPEEEELRIDIVTVWKRS